MSSVGDLCVACGLCCDGSLFSHAPLTAPESEAFEKRALPVIRRDGGERAIEQRCGALEGTACTVYAERPSACRAFRCRLYEALDADEVSFEEAASLVADARALVARVDALTPIQRHPFVAFSGSGRSRPLDRARQIDREGAMDRETRAAWTAAEKHLDRHFRARVGQRR